MILKTSLERNRAENTLSKISSSIFSTRLSRIAIPRRDSCVRGRSQINFSALAISRVLGRARERPPFDPADLKEDDMFDDGDIELERKADIRQCAAELLLVESAKAWLLGEQ